MGLRKLGSMVLFKMDDDIKYISIPHDEWTDDAADIAIKLVTRVENSEYDEEVNLCSK